MIQEDVPVNFHRTKIRKQYTVTIYVKPNADISMLIDTAKKEVSKVTENDIPIFGGGWGGGLLMMIKTHMGRDLLKLLNFLKEASIQMLLSSMYHIDLM
jgi:hypothetical protein